MLGSEFLIFAILTATIIAFRLDIVENPYRAPRPTESQNPPPPATQNKF